MSCMHSSLLVISVIVVALSGTAKAIDDGSEQTCGKGRMVARVTNNDGKLKITCIELNCTRIREETEVCDDYADTCQEDRWIRGIATDNGRYVIRCCAYKKIARGLTRSIVLTPSGEGSTYKTGYVKDEDTEQYYHEIYSNLRDISNKEFNATLGHLKCVPPPGTTEVGKFKMGERGSAGRQDFKDSNGNTISVVLGSCFDSDGETQTPNGPKSMRELQLGDEVLIALDGGIQRFDKIAYFLHRDPEMKVDFLHIHTENGDVLTLTPAHLLSVVPCEYNVASFRIADNDVWQFARDLKVGQCVLAQNAKQSSLEPQRVVRITSTSRQGIYSPVTGRGNVIVNNVLASCFSVSRETVIVRNLFETMVQFSDLFDSLLSLLTGRTTLSAQNSDTAAHSTMDFPILVRQMLENIGILVPESSLAATRSFQV